MLILTMMIATKKIDTLVVTVLPGHPCESTEVETISPKEGPRRKIQLRIE